MTFEPSPDPRSQDIPSRRSYMRYDSTRNRGLVLWDKGPMAAAGSCGKTKTPISPGLSLLTNVLGAICSLPLIHQLRESWIAPS